MVVKRRKRTALGKLSAWGFKVLQNSFIGKYFTSYEKANDKFQKITKKENKNSKVRKYRIARLLERSFVAKATPKIYQSFLRIGVSNYATAAVGMGVVSFTLFILNYLKYFTLGNVTVTLPMLVLPALLIILPLPYLFSGKSLAQAFLTNGFLHAMVFGFLGADSEAIKDKAAKPRISNTMLSFIVGISLGTVSYFIGKPENILYAISILLFAYVVMRTPEIGIILVIFTMPFVSMLVTKIAIVYITFCYIIKIILHKRVVTFEYFDIWPTLAIVGMVFTGIDYQNPKSTLPVIGSNLVILISYFIIANLIRSKDWFKKCIFALTSSAFICALVGIAQFVLGVLYNANFMEKSEKIQEVLSLFAGYNKGAPSIFSSSSAFAYYVIIAIPFALVHVFAERREALKIGGFFIAAILTLSLVAAHSNAAVIGLLFAVLLLLIIRNRNYIYLAIIAIAAPLGLYFSVRSNQAVLDFFNKFEEFRAIDPTEKLLELKNGFVLWLNSPLGKGLGSAAEYDSLLLQIFLEYGIVMAILFLVCAIMFARLVFSYCAKEKGKHRKTYCSAGLCALLGIFITGIFENVWLDSKIMLLSVLCMALSFAYIKVERDMHTQMLEGNSFNHAFVEIELAEEEYHEYVLTRKYVRPPRRFRSKVKKQETLKIKTKKKTEENEDDEDDERV